MRQQNFCLTSRSNDVNAMTESNRGAIRDLTSRLNNVDAVTKSYMGATGDNKTFV